MTPSFKAVRESQRYGTAIAEEWRTPFPAKEKAKPERVKGVFFTMPIQQNRDDTKLFTLCWTF
jgi:hypothetical protein